MKNVGYFSKEKKGYFSLYGRAQHRGFTFVEILVTIAIFTLVFGGLFGGFQLMLQLIGKSKAQAGALALMSEKMEYIRSLPYNNVGTIAGVPNGNIAQTSTTTLNGIVYNERILIQYVDDVADGIGGADSNGILADYKQIKVEYSWDLRGKNDTAALVSNIVPPSIETTAGGGTIRVNVFNANVLPLSGAEVRFFNDTTTSTIDTLRYTDLNGITYLSGAPAAANYQITVTDSGYSTDGTYVATTSNPNPVTLPVAVLESQISTMNFQIDELSDILVTTVGLPTYGSFIDIFTDASLLTSVPSTTVSGGSLVLSDDVGVYRTPGTAVSTSTAPGAITSWYAATFQASTSASTTATVSLLYDNGGGLAFVPDVDLPGNSIGFTYSPVDLTGLSVATYNTLALQTTLSTTDTAYTPQLHQWALSYVQAQSSISDIQLSIAGDKIIGTDATAKPILKYQNTGVTDGDGEWNVSDIEWDIYDIEVLTEGYNVLEVCAPSPLYLNPDTSETVQFTLSAATPQLLRVLVQEIDGTPIPDATVRLENTSVDQTDTTSLCGQTYFSSGLYDADDYTLTVDATGYTTEVTASTTINSSSTVTVILN
ncbi:MAG: prepilin-type N-terminal cleavage/methylation domain-containing protein [Acidimicrobiales bacterium]|jgi:prepilin-type N-terminal cleavage/methylation domain-containing protein